jgi:dihydrofolate synthase/folylpolyglutamate synthase
MDPNSWLGSLEPIGWRFGLDRIQRLVAALGMPQHRFASIHVVGTNGKSSVAAMASALLEGRGMRTGTYLSPHDQRWSERIRVSGEEVSPEAFADAAGRVAQAVEVVNRSLSEGDEVTQFEALTATAFVAFAMARVEVAAIEAGLGGRLDATNVLPSRVVALTSVGLEHTQWLGDTEAAIAAEKLAVLRDHSTLIVDALEPEVMALAERVAAERHARLVVAQPAGEAAALPAPYLRRNLGVAIAAAAEIAGPFSAGEVERVAGWLELPGRMEERGGEPPLILDSAHNPAGMAALAEALPEAAGRRPVVGCVAALADKDAAGMLAALAPALDAVVCTEIPARRLEGSGRPGTTATPAAELAATARAAGIGEVHEASDPARAVARARELALERGGVALMAGSHYLLGYGS